MLIHSLTEPTWCIKRGNASQHVEGWVACLELDVFICDGFYVEPDGCRTAHFVSHRNGQREQRQLSRESECSKVRTGDG